MPEQKDAARGLLATIVITAGVVAFGVYALDLHAHTCANCGYKWRHLGAFNLGDEESHTCARCGQVQWWKCGAPHVLQGSQFAGSASPPNPAYGRTPPSLPYERMGYDQSYERSSVGAAYQEVPDCDLGPCEGYRQFPPRRMHEEAPPYRAYARPLLSGSYQEPGDHQGHMRLPHRLPYGRRAPSSPYDRRSRGSSYDSMSSDPSYERRMYQSAPTRLTYEGHVPGRAYAALMPGSEDQDECQ